MTLSKIPDLQSRVIGSWQKETTIRMESNGVYNICVSVIVLEKSRAADIPELNGFVLTSCRDTSTIRVEFEGVDRALVVIETVYEWFLRKIPQFDFLIIWPRSNESCIRRELAWSDPIIVRLNAKFEFFIWNVENLECFIIATWEKKGTIWRKSDTFNWSWMTLYYLRRPFNCILPESDSFISWTRSNQISLGRHLNIIHRPFMPNKPVRSKWGLEIPHHHSPIQGRRHALFQIWIERNCSDTVFVAFKRAFQSWITHIRNILGLIST